ncbi:hypothetical protein ACQP2Y_12375 [Actinoplanes sp. CA-051413]|uniref:hypothetical protein n=1 Tax=Actinoplanes sp. CA-051413 TaxID=3239899 RepID=UPI003D96BC2D
MTGFPAAAPVVRGGFVLLDPTFGRPVRTIPFQFNPDTLTRTLEPQGIGNEPGDRLEALRLKGPPHESFKFDAEFDATDQLDRPAEHPREAANGVAPVLSALEASIYPTVDQLIAENDLAGRGMIEIAAVEAPLMVLVLGARRVVPVRLTELSVTEEAFDTSLDPIRAKVSIGVRVLTVDDVGYRHKGGQLYLQYHRQKQQFAALVTNTVADLGLTTI